MSNSTRTPDVNNQEWTQVADDAKEAAASMGEMASHAASAVGAMASQAASDVGKRADELTASAGAGIQELGDRLSKNAPQAGVLGSASQAVARTVKDGGKYIEGAKLGGMTEDIAQLIRRNPIPSVLIGFGLGWFLCRKLRS
jgi:methyl-accepting chemotaxis protein